MITNKIKIDEVVQHIKTLVKEKQMGMDDFSSGIELLNRNELSKFKSLLDQQVKDNQIQSYENITALLNELDQVLRNNNGKGNISSEWTITSHRKYTGRFIVLGKRIVRKFLKWLIDPLVEQQREFNNGIFEIINILKDITSNINSRIDGSNREEKYFYETLLRLLTYYEASVSEVEKKVSMLLYENKEELEKVNNMLVEQWHSLADDIENCKNQTKKLKSLSDSKIQETEKRLLKIDNKLATLRKLVAINQLHANKQKEHLRISLVKKLNNLDNQVINIDEKINKEIDAFQNIIKNIESYIEGLKKNIEINFLQNSNKIEEIKNFAELVHKTNDEKFLELEKNVKESKDLALQRINTINSSMQEQLEELKVDTEKMIESKLNKIDNELESVKQNEEDRHQKINDELKSQNEKFMEHLKEQQRLFFDETTRTNNQYLELKDLIEKQHGYTKSLIADTVDKMEKENIRVNNLCEDLKEKLTFLSSFVQEQKSQLTNVNKIVKEKLEEDIVNSYGIDYLQFENKFRGDREKVKENQKIYLNYFKDKKSVVDLGCGRGEFVELLLENNIEVIGVDVNSEMVTFCIDRGLPVVKSDLFDFLQSKPNNTFDGIFSAQVIEHLKPKQIIEFVKLAYKKLAPGGTIIIETINLQSLSAFSRYFYADLTHRTPIHPETLQFLLTSIGFKEVGVKYLEPLEQYKIPALDLEVADGNLQEFNEAITRLNNMLFGPQDYAVIAVK